MKFLTIHEADVAGSSEKEQQPKFKLDNWELWQDSSFWHAE
jgi:hypothetical protein